MITAPIQRIRRVWADHRQRPFWRMVQLFVDRIFRGGGDSDTEGLDLGVGLVLTLLAMPGGFVSILLLDKYGTFLQWLRGADQRGPAGDCTPRRIFLPRPFHDRYRRGRGVAMGRHFPRSPRLHESGAAAHLHPHHLFRQPGRRPFPGRV